MIFLYSCHDILPLLQLATLFAGHPQRACLSRSSISLQHRYIHTRVNTNLESKLILEIPEYLGIFRYTPRCTVSIDKSS